MMDEKQVEKIAAMATEAAANMQTPELMMLAIVANNETLIQELRGMREDIRQMRETFERILIKLANDKALRAAHSEVE